MRADDRCTGVTDAIVKKTVEFRFEQVKVDFTFCVGPVLDPIHGHDPSKMTSLTRAALDALLDFEA